MKKLFVVMVAIAAALAMTAPAWAFQAAAPGPSFQVKGRMLTDFGYQGKTKELTTNKKDDVTTAFLNVAGHSYLQANFTSADKTTGGKIEFGFDAKINDAERVTLRYGYGWWKVGNCKLTAGQDDNWVGSLAYLPRQMLGVTQSAKLLLVGWGFVYGGRHPQVNLKWTSGNWGIMIAAVQPGAEDSVFGTAPAGTDEYANLPRFDVALRFKAGGFMTTPGAGWSQLRWEGAGSGVDDNVTNYILTLPVKFTVGAFTVKGGIHYGQNTDVEWKGELTQATLAAAGSNQPQAIPVWVNGKVEDTKVFGGFLAVEYNVTPKLMITAGAGAVQTSNDNWKKLGYRDDEYTRAAYFVAVPYKITDNFMIQPEFDYFDYGDSVASNNDAGNEWLLGLQFKFVF